LQKNQKKRLREMANLSTDDWIKYSGWIIGAVSLIASIWLGLLGIRSKYARALYREQSFLLIEKGLGLDIEGLQVIFNGLECPQLTKTHLIFWNGGPVPIENEDILEPIVCSLPDDGRLAALPKVASSRGAYGFVAETEENLPGRVRFDFKYLGPNGGARIELLHTGSPKNVQMSGRLKGVPRDIECLGKISPRIRFPEIRSIVESRAFYGKHRIRIPNPLRWSKALELRVPGRIYDFQITGFIVTVVVGLVLLGLLVGLLERISSIPYIGFPLVVIALGTPYAIFFVSIAFAIRNYVRRRILRTPRELIPDYWW